MRAGSGFERALPAGFGWHAWWAWPLAAWCAWQRRRGRYRRRLLALRWWLWWRVPCAQALLQLALCRRDFGLPLPARWRAPLAQALPTLPSASARRARELLAADAGATQQAMGALRGGFAQWLAAQRAAAGVCVVGNASNLRGSRLGGRIDAHAAVLRFNRWQAVPDPEACDDWGRSWQLWALSPDCRAPVPGGLAWALLTGPDPCAALARWGLAQQLQAAKVPVLTVPLPVWRGLVRTLQAPPSAGLLVLAWLRDLGEGWQGLSCAGIGATAAPGQAAHVLPRHRRGSRHHWAAERRLVALWRQQGLVDLALARQGGAA